MATHEVTRPLALNVTALEIAQALQDVIVTTPVVDNLTTNDGSKALSAKMGKKLNDEKFPIANIASALGQDVDKVPSNKVVDDAINAINTAINGVTVRKGTIDNSHPLQLEIGSNEKNGSMGFLIMSRDNGYSFGAFCLMAGYNDTNHPIVIELGKGQWISYVYPSDNPRFKVTFSSSSPYEVSYALVTFNGTILIL